MTPSATVVAPVLVMLCDDSAATRAALGRVLEADPEIRIVGRVADGQQALATLGTLPGDRKPDVILLDLEMPVMDGMTALPLLLRAAPGVSVIVASALSQRGAAATMAALRAGAADYVPKPSAASGGVADPAFRAELLAKVKGWARMRRRKADLPATAAAAARPAGGFSAPVAASAVTPGQRPRIIAIGSSTGGPQALAALVRRLERPLSVPLVIAQHMPAGFTAMLAEHLGRLGHMPGAEARDGEVLKPGHIYVAPGDRHLLVEAAQEALVARLSDTPPENFCRPSVDPLLRSLASVCRARLLAVILTGMGQDGLAGCREVAAAGGQVLVQDEASSVVWGMPGAVARAGLAQQQLPPEELGARIMAAAGSV
jgi:two-component system chemotaxis response regulator CheB